MLGSSVTQQLFASANAIAAIPKVYAEWNYNYFLKPYVINSGSTNQILNSNFNDYNKWTAVGGNASSNTTQGRKTDYFNDTTCTSLTIDASSITSNEWNPNAVFTSSAVTLTANNWYGFYKFVFYVKAGNATKTDGIPSKITPTLTATSAGTASTAYYRVVGVGSRGQSLGPDLITNSDVASVTYSGTGSVKVVINNDANSTAYNIYRTNINSTDTRMSTASTDAILVYNIIKTPSLTTSSWADDFTLNGSYMTNYDFDSKVFVTPQVTLTTTTGATAQPLIHVKTYDSYGKGANDNNSTFYAAEDSWQKVEVLFGIPWGGGPDPSFNWFSKASLVLNIAAQSQNANILVDQLELYSITERDYFTQHFYPTDSVFLPNRPGEAFVNYGAISSLTSSLNFDNNIFYRPPMFEFSSPNILLPEGKSFVIGQKQTVSNSYDYFKYYISDYELKAVQAFYDTYITINKIVLKYNTTFNVPSSGSVIVYTGPNRTQTKIELTSSSFNNNGCTILYYNGSSWSTASWTSPPELSASGTLQNVTSSVSGISFVCNAVAVDSKWTSSSDPKSLDYSRLQLIELSPRLEIDVSPYTESFDINKELSSPYKNGLPFSYINSNSGNLKLSNIPVYAGLSGSARTIFENDPKNATFKNLLRKGVKFTGQMISSSISASFSETLPLFVMYAENWEINDIDNVTINMFDFTKQYFQTTNSPDFSAFDSTTYDIVTGYLNRCGYSDYDIQSLRNLLKGNNSTSHFWADESKTMFESLQDLLLPHQISAFIDEYGVMRFKSIEQVFDKYNSSTFSADFAVTDISSSVNPSSGSITYIANILPDTFAQQVGDKIGKVILKYKTPMVNQSADNVDPDKKIVTLNAYRSSAAASIWTLKEQDALPSYTLEQSLLATDKTMKFSNTSWTDPTKNIFSFSGDVLVGGEVIEYNGLEFTFLDTSASNDHQINRIINGTSDIDSAVEEVKYRFGSASTVQYFPTGRMMNLVRGKYGTSVKNHINVTSDNLSNYFSFSVHNNSDTVLSTALTTQYSIATASNNPIKLQTKVQGQKIMVYPKTDNDLGRYNLFTSTFSCDTAGITKKLDTTTKKVLVSSTKKHGKINYKKVNKDTTIEGTLVKNGQYYYVKKTTTSTNTKTNLMAIGMFMSLDTNLSVSNTYFVEVVNYIDSSGSSQIQKQKVEVFRGNTSLGSKEISISSVFNDVDQNNTLNRFSVYLAGSKKISVFIAGQKVDVDLSEDVLYFQSGKFGFYIRQTTTDDTSTDACLYELYAGTVHSENFDISKEQYHFVSNGFLNNIVNNIKQSYQYYLWQYAPQVRGFRLYNVKSEKRPVRIFDVGAKIQKVSYGQLNQTIGAIPGNILQPIDATDLNYSDLVLTPFRLSFAVVNSGLKGLAILSPASDSQSDTVHPLEVLAKFEVLSDEKNLIRIVDSNNINNSIELNTSWLKNEKTANRIISNIAKALDTFHISLETSVFGNPLIQIGDFAKLTYSLKRYGYDPDDSSVTPVICLVEGLSYSFQEGLSETKLKLRVMPLS